MAEHDDMATRVALLEKTMVSRDHLADRDEKLMDRFERALLKFEGRMDESLKHGLKVFGHETAEQLQAMRKKIHDEEEEKRARAVKDAPPAPPFKDQTFLSKYGLPIGIAAGASGPAGLQMLKAFGVF